MTDFEQLKASYTHCQLCPLLIKSRSQIVFGSGQPQAEMLFIGEAPGAEEDKQGVPFCGASGKVLDDLLSSAGISRDDVFVTNTILCRPENNRNPNKDEVENCRQRLDQLIQIMNPKIIVTIGNFATERILGKKGITSLRGKIFSTMINHQEIKVVPVIHPANLLYNGRNPKIMEQMKKDFQVIAEVVRDRKEQKGLGEF